MEGKYEGISENVIIVSDRDKETYHYLVRQRGKDAVELATNYLAGKRKPYVSNIAKLMKVSIPTQLQREDQAVSTDQALLYLEQMKKILLGEKKGESRNC